MSALENVTDTTFADNVLTSGKPVAVHFWATWCEHCEASAPVIEEVADELRDTLTVAKLDVDENPSTVSDYQVTSIPTLLVFQDGKPVKRIDGTQPKASLLDELAAVTG
jgi:thioredoxin 1